MTATAAATQAPEPCRYCGARHTLEQCPFILAISYWPNGAIRHVRLARGIVVKPAAAAPRPQRRKSYQPRSVRRALPLPLAADEKLDVSIGELSISLSKHRIWWKKMAIHFTGSEFKIVAALAARPGVVFERDTLLTVAAGQDAEFFERMVDSHIKRIRLRFKEADADFAHIDTVYGIGYRWTP